jgi:hypothetical protein
MTIDSAMVAMASGSTPCLIIGSTTTSLKPAPKISRKTAMPSSPPAQSGRPKSLTASRISTAGSMTNSPWAKLIVCEVCQTSVKPIAASA